MWLFNKSKNKKKNATEHVKNVGDFYDKNHDSFIKVYGEVIQAFRTNNLDNILNYQIEQIGLKPEHIVLDAGCGVCGPARFFAKNVGCSIDAVSISATQVNTSLQHIQNEKLEDKIKVHLQDYHEVDKIFSKERFDKVYFLESFGHSPDKEKLLKAIWKVLKPGGEVYIKDLFRRISKNWLVQRKIDSEIKKINEAYIYDVADLNAFVDMVRAIGFVIVFIKTIDIPLEDFENLSISNEFQELTGIAKIDNWEKYIFPIDFFEVKLYKPEYDIEKGKSRYFLQNIYQMQMNHINKENL
jgi:cyclopropane fatty-acyl-phospholipid synthase-like methyltransferase